VAPNRFAFGGRGVSVLTAMEGAGQPWHSLGMAEVIEYFLTRTTPDGVVTSMGGVLAGDDQAALAEASKDVRARFEQQELSLADLISVEDPDGRQVEEASVAELLKR
jgi:hypothetical protein